MLHLIVLLAYPLMSCFQVANLLPQMFICKVEGSGLVIPQTSFLAMSSTVFNIIHNFSSLELTEGHHFVS